MSHDRDKLAPIPYESRLLRGLRRLHEDREFIRTAERVARETGTELIKVIGAKLPGDPAALRGIPAIGRNVSGAQPETRPGWNLE